MLNIIFGAYDVLGYVFLVLHVIARIAAYLAGPATFVIFILAFVGVVNWSLVLILIGAGFAALIACIITGFVTEKILG